MERLPTEIALTEQTRKFKEIGARLRPGAEQGGDHDGAIGSHHRTIVVRRSSSPSSSG